MSLRINLVMLFFALVLSPFQSSAQAREFSVFSSVNDVIAPGVTVEFAYTLPTDDPLVKAAKTDPAMTPALIIWYWGDDPEGAKTRNYSALAYAEGQKTTHTYKKPGTYGITVIVNDRKNRNIKQASVQIRIQQPVVIVTQQ